MKTYKIEELTLEELNTILQGLSQLPYFQVAELIGKVKTQGDKQFVEKLGKFRTEEIRHMVSFFLKLF